MCVARSPEGKAAAERASTPLPITPMTREQALQQAQAEGLALRTSDNKSGYANVTVLPGRREPYQAQVYRSGKTVTVGSFAIAEEAALCVARSPEGKVAAERAAAAALPRPQLTREQALQQAGYANLTVLPSGEALQRARDAIIEAVALEIIYQAAEAAAIELGTEVATEVMAGIALGL